MTEAMGRTGVRTCLRTGLILVMPMVKAIPQGKRSTIFNPVIPGRYHGKIKDVWHFGKWNVRRCECFVSFPPNAQGI
jgi:hypothetical protein